MKMYDLNTQEELDGNGKIKQATPGPTLELNNKDVPELSDYKVGDEISMHVITKVKSMNMGNMDTPTMKPGEKKADTGQNAMTSMGNMSEPDMVSCKLEIMSIGIENETADRKKANERGLDKETSKQIDIKRGQGRE